MSAIPLFDSLLLFCITSAEENDRRDCFFVRKLSFGSLSIVVSFILSHRVYKKSEERDKSFFIHDKSNLNQIKSNLHFFSSNLLNNIQK